MKKLLTITFAVLAVLVTKAQTADEVINKYVAAAGGKDKLLAVKSLQYTQTANLNTPIGAVEVKMNWIRVESKLFRLNTTSEMFGTGFSLVTDTSGWILIPANPFADDSKEKLQKLSADERKGLASQMNCDGFFPELVNYSAKGYKVESAGEGKAGGRASYKIRLKKDKDERLYYIDKQNGLVNAMTVKGSAAMTMSGMGNTGMGENDKADKLELTFYYSGYKDFGGIKIPGTVKLELPMGILESSISEVKVNQFVDLRWYKPR